MIPSGMDMLIAKVLDELRAYGISEQNIWRTHYRFYSIVKRHLLSKGQCDYDEKALFSFAQETAEKYSRRELSRVHAQSIMKAIERLDEVHATGKLSWSFKRKGSRYRVSDSLEELIAAFAAATTYTDNTKGDVIWVLRKYLFFLEGRGHEDFSHVREKDLADFLVHCSQHMKRGSLSNVRTYIRAFHRYLLERRLSHIDAESIGAAPITRGQKVFPCITPEELTLILRQVNRAAPVGKRNYAIILLGAFCGMRAADIVNLKLTDIDWADGEIRLVQQKTQEFLTMPLMQAVGEAIKDYILYGRPATDSEYLFVRVTPPHVKLTNGIAVMHLFNDYQKKAGIVRTPYDGKGFHALRRAMGTNLVYAKVPLETVSQVLGQRNPNAAKQYIFLDSDHLKECALDLNGIEVAAS